MRWHLPFGQPRNLILRMDYFFNGTKPHFFQCRKSLHFFSLAHIELNVVVINFLKGFDRPTNNFNHIALVFFLFSIEITAF